MSNALDSLLADLAKKSQSKHVRDCTAVGCQERIFGYALFCPACWQKCPSDLRRCIEKHHKPGRAASKVLAKLIQQAMNELLYLRTEGHYKPRDVPFMWDDAPAAAETPSGDLFEEPNATPKR